MGVWCVIVLLCAMELCGHCILGMLRRNTFGIQMLFVVIVFLHGMLAAIALITLETEDVICKWCIV